MPASPAAPTCGAPGTAEPRSDAGGACQPRAHRLYAEMEAHPGAVPYARRCTRQALAAWRLGSIADDVELVASELVTNSVTATLSLQIAAPVAVYLALERCGLFVLVWDASPDLPASRDHAEDAESGRGLELSGRGLELVTALSAEWGAWLCAEQGGKVTWARFELRGQRRHSRCGVS